MSEAKPHMVLCMADFLSLLASRNFYFGVDTHVLIRRFFDTKARTRGRVLAVELEQFGYQLGALLCQNAEQQAKFRALFEQFVAENSALNPPNEVETPVTPPQPIQQTQPTKAETRPATVTAPRTSSTPQRTVGKSGPVRIELNIPPDTVRLWNVKGMEAAVKPLLEKEWGPQRGWDMRKSIRQTVRAGGMPVLVPRLGKIAPQYLFLIDQRSHTDHLSGLFVDLVLELRRRDLDVAYYFYDGIPVQCWKDRRDPKTFTTVAALHSEYSQCKLILIGPAAGLLDKPELIPSNVAIDLFESWKNMALLCPKSTTDWGVEELALCQLVPVVPANALGLAHLVPLWNAQTLLAPRYWKSASHDHPTPPLDFDTEAEAQDVLDELEITLGQNGFNWLCAAAIYPEIYYALTVLLHDEAVQPSPDHAQSDQNEIWLLALMRLSRLNWMRKGEIPTVIRRLLRDRLKPNHAAGVRAELIRVIQNTKVPQGSFAESNLQYTVAWLYHEAKWPFASENERAGLENAFSQKTATVALSEIEDALGIDFLKQFHAERPRSKQFAVVNGENIVVSSGPGERYDRIMELAGGTVVEIIGEREGYWQIGPQAWVQRGLMQEVTDAAQQQKAASFYPVLWVDDQREKTREFRFYTASRYRILYSTAENTAAALVLLSENRYECIVSDIGRGEEKFAGRDMLQQFKTLRIKTPVVFYTAPSNASQLRESLMAMGAKGVFKESAELELFLAGQLGVVDTSAADTVAGQEPVSPQETASAPPPGVDEDPFSNVYQSNVQQNAPNFQSNTGNVEQNAPNFEVPESNLEQNAPNFEAPESNVEQNAPNFEVPKGNVEQNAPNFEAREQSIHKPPFLYNSDKIREGILQTLKIGGIERALDEAIRQLNYDQLLVWKGQLSLAKSKAINREYFYTSRREIEDALVKFLHDDESLRVRTGAVATPAFADIVNFILNGEGLKAWSELIAKQRKEEYDTPYNSLNLLNERLEKGLIDWRDYSPQYQKSMETLLGFVREGEAEKTKADRDGARSQLLVEAKQQLEAGNVDETLKLLSQVEFSTAMFFEVKREWEKLKRDNDLGLVSPNEFQNRTAVLNARLAQIVLELQFPDLSEIEEVDSPSETKEYETPTMEQGQLISMAETMMQKEQFVEVLEFLLLYYPENKALIDLKKQYSPFVLLQGNGIRLGGDYKPGDNTFVNAVRHILKNELFPTHQNEPRQTNVRKTSKKPPKRPPPTFK